MPIGKISYPPLSPVLKNDNLNINMKITTNNYEETINYGQSLSHYFKGGDIVCLFGDLGAGKTTLIKGIGQGLGLKKNITSPTFAIMDVYPVKNSSNNIKNIVHIDTYRLKDEAELLEIGINDYLGQADTLCLVEWPEKIKKLLKGKKAINITLSHQADNQRLLVISD